MARARLWLAAYAVALIVLWWHATRAGMDNRGFLVAGYGVTWGVLLAYARRLERRGRAASGALQALAERPAGETAAHETE